MKVVLRQDVENLGEKGSVKNVADGYARNYLIPKGMAVVATPGEMKVVATNEAVKQRKIARQEQELQGLADRINTRVASMDELNFDEESLDVIWSEGAIYNIGFQDGVRSWRRFLRPGGVLAVSEITWLTDRRPAELEDHWTSEYPEVATASTKLAVLEASGYSPLGYFPLPESCWLDHYYRPMQSRFGAFLDRHGHSAAANEIVEAEQHEIDLYERFSAFVSYGFFIATRTTA